MPSNRHLPRRTATRLSTTRPFERIFAHLPRGALAGADVELCARADRAEFLAKGQLRSESSQDDPVRRALSWFPLFFLPGHGIALRVVSSSATSTS